MKTTMFTRIGLLSVTTAAILLATSCKKDEPINEIQNDDDDKEMTSIQNNNLADVAFSDLDAISDEGMVQAESQTKSGTEKVMISNTATITYIKDSTINKGTLTIDFGSTNLLCPDGKYRRGKIIITHTGRYKEEGSSHTITTNNYFVNDNEVKGSRKVENKGKNSNGHLTFTINVDGAIVLANNGGSITWKCTREREWIAGDTTRFIGDDVFDITGSTSGTDINGEAYSAVIKSALRRDLTCHYRFFTKGILEVKAGVKRTRTINYGDGECDTNVKVTVGDKTYDVTLER